MMASIAYMFKPTCLTPVAGESYRARAVVPVYLIDTCRPVHARVIVTFIDV